MRYQDIKIRVNHDIKISAYNFQMKISVKQANNWLHHTLQIFKEKGEISDKVLTEYYKLNAPMAKRTIQNCIQNELIESNQNEFKFTDKGELLLSTQKMNIPETGVYQLFWTNDNIWPHSYLAIKRVTCPKNDKSQSETKKIPITPQKIMNLVLDKNAKGGIFLNSREITLEKVEPKATPHKIKKKETNLNVSMEITPDRIKRTINGKIEDNSVIFTKDDENIEEDYFELIFYEILKNSHKKESWNAVNRWREVALSELKNDEKMIQNFTESITLREVELYKFGKVGIDSFNIPISPDSSVTAKEWSRLLLLDEINSLKTPQEIDLIAKDARIKIMDNSRFSPRAWTPKTLLESIKNDDKESRKKSETKGKHSMKYWYVQAGLDLFND